MILIFSIADIYLRNKYMGSNRQGDAGGHPPDMLTASGCTEAVKISQGALGYGYGNQSVTMLR